METIRFRKAEICQLLEVAFHMADHQCLVTRSSQIALPEMILSFCESERGTQRAVVRFWLAVVRYTRHCRCRVCVGSILTLMYEQVITRFSWPNRSQTIGTESVSCAALRSRIPFLLVAEAERLAVMWRISPNSRSRPRREMEVGTPEHVYRSTNAYTLGCK